MDQKVVWSVPASNHLIQITRYIALDSPQYAEEFLLEVQLISSRLTPFPYRGRKVPEFNASNIREVFLMNYRLIYLIEERQITVLGLVHGARNLWSV